MELQGNREETLSALAYSFAIPEDEAQVRELLIASGLPDADISPHLSRFIVAKDGHRIVGCIGLEIAEDCGLLRSLAVAAPYRSLGVGSQLCDRLVDYARTLGFQTLYLMTTTAAEYFAQRGYERLDRALAPEAIRSTRQFIDLCPSSAIVMKTAL